MPGVPSSSESSVLKSSPNVVTMSMIVATQHIDTTASKKVRGIPLLNNFFSLLSVSGEKDSLEACARSL